MPISDYIKRLRAKIGNDLLLVPGVTAVVVNEHEEILLQLRRDTQTWAPPSGGLEPGENLAQCVIREVFEETALEIVPDEVIAVLSGKDFSLTYPKWRSNRDCMPPFSAVSPRLWQRAARQR